MNEQWQELKETIVELRDNDGTGTQQEVCKFLANLMDVLENQMSSSENQNKWIPVSEGLPKTDNENSINNYNVLLWVKNKSHPEREPQIYLGKLRHNDGDDGSGNFWGIETKPCDWTIWGWSYFNEPEVMAWMPLPKPYKASPTGAGCEGEG